MKQILVTGLCTLHWGRLQYGNVGNYYIVEPLVRLLHKYFPEYEIVTTFQMDQKFIDAEDIRCVPMELYYSWDKDDVIKAKRDVEIASKIAAGSDVEETPYITELKKSEYIINISGDMWGDNAEHVGKDRLLVDCLKMKAAQILNKKTILYAVTPGAFEQDTTDRELAKEVFEDFDLVVIREKVSFGNLEKWGFSLENVVWAPCPSYLFKPNKDYNSVWTNTINSYKKVDKKVIGMTFGGFNMPVGPYDMWPRNEEQYDNFVALAEYILNDLESNLVIFSHTNGFELPPKFKMINGRDFMILNQLYQILIEKNTEYKERILLIDEPLLPCDLKSVIGSLDMLITGRVHASVAATSQCIPTVYMEYDRNVIYSDKMTGFSSQIGMEEYVCAPGNLEELKKNTKNCFTHLEEIKDRLNIVIPEIQKEAANIIEVIKNV